MKEYQKEIVKLTAKEVLCSVFDLALPFFSASKVYRASANQYLQEREKERSELLEKIKYLKRHGLIKTFVEGKEKYIEVTPKGLRRIKYWEDNPYKIERQDRWDGKWRIVIFDIPNKRKASRDALRGKLLSLGFIKVQESVYVYPFECAQVIAKLVKNYLISDDNVLISISEIIQGEDALIEKFLDNKILLKSDLTQGK